MAKKKGLWANIHAKRKRGERPARPGEEGYPKTLDIAQEGGMLYGPSHDNGGVVIEAEGNEYIIQNGSVNAETKPVLEYINEYGKLPVRDARKRGKK